MGKYLTSEAFLKVMTKRVARGYRFYEGRGAIAII